MSKSHIAYRADIDGLRAVAVGAVVLFHAGMPGVSGGFVGVDIFFVISGFLITSILAREIGEGRYSILSFYERRVRRIFPALFSMMLVAAFGAAVILLPGDFREFGDSIAAATLFVSNVFFWQQSDYFAGPAHLKPLLHTWSLAVEEQFYIVFPVLLAAVWRFGHKAVCGILAGLFVVSFAASAWGAIHRPVATFYLAPARAWELLAGALIALGALPAITSALGRELAAGVGALLIAFGIGFYSDATAFPGVAALAPVLGSVLVIHAGAGASTAVTRLLSLRPIVFVGLISYSLYLWHWPLFALARYWTGAAPAPTISAMLVALSVALATLSWRYIERPFRQANLSLAPRPLLTAGASVMAIAVAVGVSTHIGNGWGWRFPDYAPPQIAGRDRGSEGRCFLTAAQPPSAYAGIPACRRAGGVGVPSVVVWGDSFASHLMPGLAASEAGLSFVEMTASGCPPILGRAIPRRPHCRAFNDAAVARILAMKPAAVVVSARWESYVPRVFSAAALDDTIGRLAAEGIPVVLVGQSPSFDFASPYDYVYRKGTSTTRVRFSPTLNAALAGRPDVRFVDPLAAFCEGATCRLKDGDDYLFYDGGHFSLIGSGKMAALLLPVLRDMAGMRRSFAARALNTP